ncbi:alpha beta-hydrolase isoform B [Chlorella sorokiniana]|uniref:Alpha beta-hydrolase isoform B n=1 Tax=Chlorella sorokiniana TaxID=3076 RepID=A0A2P6U2K7_CHLSO|nr:alpha beta-hydrolase isoform B [Chlorella sorokiniana]|eukprot:PRW60544.1 alpha beta-hydrolase isoform B [Chlorella sorokiniana]
MSADPSDQQAPASPGVQQGAVRAEPRGLEAYPSLQAAFAAPQPARRFGLQNHSTGVQPRLVVKTPTNNGPCDTPLPRYQHDTDNAISVDVALLWRALSHSHVPEHKPFTLEKYKFNHEVDYQGDPALVAKLSSLPDFPALKAFLTGVLVPPPKPRGGQTSGVKRKSIGGDWPDRKRLYKGQGNLFEKLLTRDNLKGFEGAQRLCIPTAAMTAEPFEWQPADPGSKEPPTILLSCAELKVVDVDATLGKRTTDGYRMGKGTQGLLKKLKAKPDDIMQLQVTKKEGDTIWAELALKRHQRAAATGGSTGGTPAASGAATGGGSMRHNPSTNGGAAAAAAAAAGAAEEPAGPAESASPSPKVSASVYGGSDHEEDEDDEVIITSGRGSYYKRPANAGHGGALLQEVLRRWTQVSEETRELVAIAVATLPLHSEWREQGRQPMLQQLRRALNTAGEDWHTSIVEPGSGAGAAERPPSQAEQTCRQRAAATCEEAAALLIKGQTANSQQLRRPLGWLAVANIGGAPVQEADDGWAGFSPAQQRRLFDDVLIAVHQGVQGQLWKEAAPAEPGSSPGSPWAGQAEDRVARLEHLAIQLASEQTVLQGQLEAARRDLQDAEARAASAAQSSAANPQLTQYLTVTLQQLQLVTGQREAAEAERDRLAAAHGRLVQTLERERGERERQAVLAQQQLEEARREQRRLARLADDQARQLGQQHAQLQDLQQELLLWQLGHMSFGGQDGSGVEEQEEEEEEEEAGPAAAAGMWGAPPPPNAVFLPLPLGRGQRLPPPPPPPPPAIGALLPGAAAEGQQGGAPAGMSAILPSMQGAQDTAAVPAKPAEPAQPAQPAAEAESAAAAEAAAATWEDDVCRYQRGQQARVEAPVAAPPIVLLPGFGNCTQDYVAPFGDEDAGVAAVLQRRGFKVYVLPLERKDWFKVGRALFTRAYWSTSCTTHPGYTWYLERVKELVDTARLETGADQVDLLCHSAGGWLGRAFLGQGQFKDGAELSQDTLGSADSEPHPAVRALVTLGTPHTPPPAEKVKDMTGGALTWVNATWPGAAFAEQGVKYVSVAGRAVRGNKEADRRTLSGYANGSYEQVCGEGHRIVGDAVVPLGSALLDGAQHVVLDGVFHSMSRGLLRPSRERLVIGVPADVPRSGDGGGEQRPAQRRPKPRPPPPPANEATPFEQQQVADGQPAAHLHRPKPRTSPPLAGKARAGSPRRQRPSIEQAGSDSSAQAGGNLQGQLRGTRSPERVVQLVQQAGARCDVADVTLAVNQLAKLGTQDSSLADRCRAAFQQLAQLALGQLLDPWAVAQFVWAAARLWEGQETKQPFGEQQAAWQQRLTAALEDRGCKPQSVSNGLWGASKLGWPLKGSLAAEAEAAVLRLARGMSPQAISNTLLAYANGGWQLSSAAATALLQRLEQALKDTNPQEVADSLWAAAKLGLRLSGSLQAAFAQTLPRIMPAATSQALANVLWACGTLGWSPGPRALEAAVAAMQQVLPPGTLKAQELNNFLWGLAELQDLGASLPDTLPAQHKAAADWAASRWGQLSAFDVADLCYNLARLGHQPGSDWLGSATERCLECIAEDVAEGTLFGNFIWACSSWGHRLQRSELEQLVPAAVDNVCGNWAEKDRGGALQLCEALTRQAGFRVGPDHPAASAALEGRLLPLKAPLRYLASWASHLAAIGLRLPDQQLEALCSYVGQHAKQLRAGDRACLQRAFETWGYQPGLALLASM